MRPRVEINQIDLIRRSGDVISYRVYFKATTADDTITINGSPDVDISEFVDVEGIENKLTEEIANRMQNN